MKIPGLQLIFCSTRYLRALRQLADRVRCVLKKLLRRGHFHFLN